MAMKMLMESWRGFVNSAQALEEAKFTFSTRGLALIVEDEGESISMVLYYVKPGYQNDVLKVEVAGGVEMMKTMEPCIPETWEVNSIFTAGDYQGQGLGSLMYGLCFHVAGKKGFGLTSDHSVGTKEKAAGKWKSLEKKASIVKRTTAAGNSKFDYDGETPDPDDDCDSGFGGPESMATHYSLEDKEHSKFASMFRTLKSRHAMYLKSSARPKEMLEHIEDEASRIFQEEYEKAK